MPDVSIVICTCDRAVQLEQLLHSIAVQETLLTREILVVDNHPEAKALGELRERFGEVRWLEEPRRGLSYARNAGIRAARGQAVVFVDDDMTVPPLWLENLAGGVVGGDFGMMMGPVLPEKLDTRAEQIFEAYGGHGHSMEPGEYDLHWLRQQRFVLPLWSVGGVGNSAVSRRLFEDSRIGLFEEALGVGTRAGSWEDLYFLYLLLRGRETVRREPRAAVSHAHRETMTGLREQLCGYRRGEVCFCLLVLFRHGDLRGLSHLFFWIPWWRFRLLAGEINRRLQGDRLLSFSLMARETLAYLGGPWALVASLRRAAALRVPDGRGK